MKKWWPLGVFVVGLSLVLLYQYQKYRVAPTVDVFKLKYVDTSGTSVDLNAWKGKKKIIYSFFGTWCGECVLELKQLNEAKKNELKEIEIIVVSDEDIDKITAFARRKHYPFTFLKIDRPFADLSIFAIPVNYLINSKGEITYSKVGALNWKDHSVVSMTEGSLR
jgi:peroxiredoxin